MFIYKRIYVAVDGSKESDYAFEKAISICKRNINSKLIAIRIMDRASRMGLVEMATNAVYIDHYEDERDLEKHYMEKVQQYDVPFEMKVKEGAPSSTLLKEFKALGQDDLVVCGSCNLNRIERLLLGSVSSNIVNQSSCDVLVVRTPESKLEE